MGDLLVVRWSSGENDNMGRLKSGSDRAEDNSGTGGVLAKWPSITGVRWAVIFLQAHRTLQPFNMLAIAV